VLPSPRTEKVVAPVPPCPSNMLSVSDADPLFTVRAPKDVSVNISGVVELSYACCKLVVEIPPAAPPKSSPNLDTKDNWQLFSSSRSVVPFLIVIRPIRIPLSLLFTYSVNCSVETAAIAFAREE
jgi:hypothetical protein